MRLRTGKVISMNEKNSQHDADHIRNAVKGGLLGLAVGDALGVPVEFLDRETVRNINITEMVGVEDNLPFRSRWGQLIPAGSWSDDTSMTVAAIDAIVRDKGRINYDHIMDSFIEWWYGGKYTSLGEPFGLGGVVGKALEKYQRGVSASGCGGTGFKDNGNGSLMRILPFSLYCAANDFNEEETVEFINKASSITHAHEISRMACVIYTDFLRCLINTGDPQSAHRHICSKDYSKYFSDGSAEQFSGLLRPDFRSISADSISENNGYVVPTLESAIYSVINTDNYEDAAETAINMGYDTDTVGAVAGSLAGILYGYDNIPERWLNKLRKREELEKLADSYSDVLSAMI